ncbi:MAG TPA: hypothetical protein VK034_02290 [Enhygromyxa sp.]|nr:hypothetical protein [Enhygromyxa sp.]
MTTANIDTAIERALALKPDEGPLPRISKKEAQQIVDAARQGAGPDSHEESIHLAAFVLGPNHPELLELLDGDTVGVPDFGEPGRDYVIDDRAARVFDSYFRRHAVPVAGARAPIVAEMTDQLLNLGKGKTSPGDGPTFRVDLDGRHVGRLDANTREFFIEDTQARADRSVYHGPFALSGYADFGKR